MRSKFLDFKEKGFCKLVIYIQEQFQFYMQFRRLKINLLIKLWKKCIFELVKTLRASKAPNQREMANLITKIKEEDCLNAINNYYKKNKIQYLKARQNWKTACLLMQKDKEISGISTKQFPTLNLNKNAYTTPIISKKYSYSATKEFKSALNKYSKLPNKPIYTFLPTIAVMKTIIIDTISGSEHKK